MNRYCRHHSPRPKLSKKRQKQQKYPLKIGTLNKKYKTKFNSNKINKKLNYFLNDKKQLKDRSRILELKDSLEQIYLAFIWNRKWLNYFLNKIF